MTEHLLSLTDTDLREIVVALRSRRLSAPFSPVGLQRLITGDAQQVSDALQELAHLGLSNDQLAATLDLLLRDRWLRPKVDDIFDLVTTGPEAPGIANRDTSVVVRELFAHATTSVVVAGYAVYQGQRVFQALADRMVECPGLSVRLFLDVQRGPGDTSLPGELVRRFADRLRNQEWPKDRPLPHVFFDPRSLETVPQKRACLHAKCIAVDQRVVFVSSANFTEAAQERNLEMGLLVRSPSLAERMVRHFDALVSEGALRSLF